MSGDENESGTTRRNILAGALAIGAYLSGVFTGSATAQSSSGGEVGSKSTPARTVYADKIHYTPLSSDPSSPDDGTEWYNP